MLNCLPDDLQRDILFKLPTQDAARTGVLSRNWRSMWRSIPYLNFIYHDFPESERKAEHFAEFINNTLRRHYPSVVELFAITICTRHGSYPCIRDSWVSFALAHCVQTLILKGVMQEQQLLPSRLFTCKSLVKLDISLINYVFRWPTTANLPNLKALTLKHLVFADKSVNLGLFKSCPLLASLIVIYCNMSHVRHLSISAPVLYLKLAYSTGISGCAIKLTAPSLYDFEYVDSMALDYDLSGLPAEEYSSLVMFCGPRPLSPEQFLHCGIQFCSEFQNVTHLVVDIWFIEFLSRAHHLKEVNGMIFDIADLDITILPNRKHLETLVNFLILCPLLLNLKIVISNSEGFSENVSNLRLGNMLDYPIHTNLEHIKIKNLGGLEGEMELVKYFLGNANGLLEIELTPPKRRLGFGGPKIMGISFTSWINIKAKVLDFERASSNVKFIFGEHITASLSQ